MGTTGSTYRFNDMRLERRQAIIEDKFVQSLNCSIHKTGSSDSFLKGTYRFLNNSKVTESELIESLQDQCRANVGNKDVLAFCDTSSFNIDNHKNRITDYTGLGSIGKSNDYITIGFLMHPILVYEAQTGIPLGIGDVELITRPLKAKREKSKRYQTKDIVIEQKESYKWVEPCLVSKQKSLAHAKHITFVMDREGDIMEVFDRLKDERTDVLVRSHHNRNIETPTGETMKLNAFISSQEVIGKKTIKVQGKKRKKRDAKVEIRIGRCKLLWPKGQKVSYKNNEQGVEVSIIEVRETTHEGYRKESPLIWRLISTKSIQTKEEALTEVGNYEQRWRIEEYFKLLKSDGYNIEGTQLEKGTSIRKLSLILMKTSIKVLQLKAARSGKGNMKTKNVFKEQEIACLNQLNQDLSGDTEKQKNPYDSNQLSWASWIIARLGGWKEFYTDKRPPGNKTFVWGLEKFEAVMIGYNISKKKDVS